MRGERMDFADHIQRYMHENKLSMNALSKVIGCSANTIESWVNGLCIPTRKFIPVIERVFGKTAKELGLEKRCPICGALITRDRFKFCDNCMKIPKSRRMELVKRKTKATADKPQRNRLPMPDIEHECRFCKFWDKDIAGCGGCLRILEKDHKSRAVDENGKCIRFERGKRIPNRGLYI